LQLEPKCHVSYGASVRAFASNRLASITKFASVLPIDKRKGASQRVPAIGASAVACGDDGIASFNLLRHRWRGSAAHAAGERLQVTVSRLRERLTEVQAAEEDDRRRVAYEKARAERDELAAEFARVYPPLAAQLADLLGVRASVIASST
jgi:hypothetical protein